MQHFSFEALGTVWNISIDGTKFPQNSQKEISSLVDQFEQTYSRFIPTSLIGKMNALQDVEITPELSSMLAFGNSLKKASQGYFDLGVGRTLGNLGYGKGQQSLDLGSFGKGWLIDLVAENLQSNNHAFFIIEAGGDIFGTTKQSGSAWKVVLEHPTKTNTALGILEIKNTAVAASNPFKRTWNNYHHLIDTQTSQPINKDRAIFTIAKKASVADGIATCLSVSPQPMWENIASEFKSEYFALHKTGSHMTPGFKSLFKN